MRSKTFLTTTLLTLALSSVAMAADQRDQRHPNDRYDRYDRYDRSDRYDRYDRYDDRYPDGRGTQRVAAMAREIEDVAASIRRQAERNNRRPDRDEARMLSALRELHEEADDFRDEVGDYRRDSGQDVRGFRELLRAYDLTAESLRYVSRRPYVDNGMERIGYLIDQISRSAGYDTRDRFDRYGRGRGRYDRYNRN